MADPRNPLPFEPRKGGPSGGRPKATEAIPKHVANRMARRVVIATGIPSVMGMAVFVVSYLLVSRGIMDIPPGLTLVSSGAFFLLGLGGLSYGVLSASWEPTPGTLLGFENLRPNLQRMRASIKAQKQG
ncbi:PAM68 family protein [Synechococcus sp. HK01-R]|uniref:PAM68 family protein n=1 Tax=Synechococcus sp. HK01-R TaxID=2751171 RepID=UPI001628B54B|nr:PAM68 family protein [Synechococcus sp. HK01-R]QNG26765.1 PAM68 family protein [Synechococcus sp. HK01-R]